MKTIPRDNNTNDRYPEIFGDIIVYQEILPDGSPPKVMAYDILTDYRQTIEANAHGQAMPDIYEEKVVWSQNHTSSAILYSMT